MINIVISLLLFISLASCSLVSRAQVYHAGDLTIRVYADREQMIRDLPKALQVTDSLDVRHGIYYITTVRGAYDPASKTIWTVDSTETLIHELKHYFGENHG